MQRFVLQPMQPLLGLFDPTIRTAATAADEMVELAVGKAHPGERGYFVPQLVSASGSDESNNKGKQERLWVKSLEWAKVREGDTALETAF